MARPDLTAALDALFYAAGDMHAAAADLRPVTPEEFHRQRELFALAVRIRAEIARIGNAQHDAKTDTVSDLQAASLKRAA